MAVTSGSAAMEGSVPPVRKGLRESFDLG